MGAPTNEVRLFASIRRLLATTLELAQVRIDLLGTEFELEKRRIFDGLLWGAIAVVVLSVGLLMACGFVMLLFWDSYRLVAAGVIALLFLGGGALLVRGARHRLKSVAGIFHLSVGELERDIAEMRSTNNYEQR